jgi:hypothetical protein
MTAERQQGLGPDDAADMRGEYPVVATFHSVDLYTGRYTLNIA